MDRRNAPLSSTRRGCVREKIGPMVSARATALRLGLDGRGTRAGAAAPTGADGQDTPGRPRRTRSVARDPPRPSSHGASACSRDG
jgi:hypothetical protein